MISADPSVPLAFIEKLVEKKASWITRCIKRMGERQSRQKEYNYISGEMFPFLDRQLTLKVNLADKKEVIWYENDILNIAVFEPNDREDRKSMVDYWYKKQGERFYAEALDRIYPLVAPYGIKKPSITVRTMKTRWGSCSWQRCRITLNSELLKTSLECIEYVILHELAHFRHHEHDANFYGFLTSLMPDWGNRRQQLKDFKPGYQ